MLKNLRGRIYNIGCKLPIIRPYMQFVQQYLQPGVIYEKCSRFSLRSYASVRPFKLLNKYSVKLIFWLWRLQVILILYYVGAFIFFLAKSEKPRYWGWGKPFKTSIPPSKAEFLKNWNHLSRTIIAK